MQKYNKPEIDESQMGVNPFLNSLNVIVHTIDKKNHFYYDGKYKLPSTFTVEREDKTSLYTSANKRKKIVKMHKSTQALFLWVLYEMKVGKEYLWLNKQRFMEESGFSYNTYKKAAKELVENGILAKTIYKDTYWINPDYCYAGNRVRKFKEQTVEYITKREFEYLKDKGVIHGQ